MKERLLDMLDGLRQSAGNLVFPHRGAAGHLARQPIGVARASSGCPLPESAPTASLPIPHAERGSGRGGDCINHPPAPARSSRKEP